MSHLSLSRVVKSQPGWYRGDFHLHTTASDGLHSANGLVQLAKTHGLDFFAITDHNTIDAYPAFDDDPEFLVIPGIEVTLNEGHFNVFGIEGRRDWLAPVCVGEITTTLKGKGLSVTDLLRQTAAQGLFNSIDHPLLNPWAWLDKEADLRHVHGLEVWNDPLWPPNAQANPRAVALWTAWLNEGYRITAIGGSDFHFLPGEHKTYPGEYPGLPTTHVYAEQLSGAAILAGLRERRVYVSLGPQVSFRAHANGKTFEIGDDLGQAHSGGAVELVAGVSNHQETVRMQVLKNGQVLAQATARGGAEGLLRFGDPADAAQPAWYRLDVFDGDGRLLALTNPIFAGPRREPRRYRYTDFAQDVNGFGNG
jgi:hypothetical protein